MNAALELRLKIESREVLHPEFVTHFTKLKQRVDDTLNGLAPRIEWMTGPTRVGKSMLRRALAREYPETRVAGRRQVPVLAVTLLPGVTSKLLPSMLLSELGVPLPQRGLSSGAMVNRLVDQLRLSQTRVIFIDEASHLVEPGSRLAPRAAGDWFKDLHDRLGATLILSGVPRLQRLFESNEQLRLRSSSRREFRNYSWQAVEEQRSFAVCVFTYAELFKEAGWPIELPLETLVKHCYLLSGGLVGVLSRFMEELAAQVTDIAPRPLTFEDCRAAAAGIESAGHPLCPAFERVDVAAVELSQAYGHVLEENELSARRRIT